jgi:hypothetical protein
MPNKNNDIELLTPVELRQRDLWDIAGGSPTLPLPPPARCGLAPVPPEPASIP